MDRYIDADELKRKFKHFCEGNCKRCGHSTFLADDEQCGLIDQTPTADVVEVVRCKDCVYRKVNFLATAAICEKVLHTIENETDFCSYGKKVE